MIIPSAEIESEVLKHSMIAPASRYEAERVVRDPELWFPEASNLDALLAIWMTLLIASEQLSAYTRMLGPERHATKKAMFRLQAMYQSWRDGMDEELIADFVSVVKDRVRDEDRLLIGWPPSSTDLPGAPEGSNSSAWGLAVARWRVRHAHLSWSWRTATVGLLGAPQEGIGEKLMDLPSEVQAAQRAAEAAAQRLEGYRATSAEMAVQQTQARAAARMFEDAMARRRRDSLRSADAGGMMGGSKR